ncbi:MFS transporter [Burkholderia ubonensis]|uniref:MFS transporter n=2 Tax=Burkholderia ubonensis TaxID=101571 RepID=UPI000A573869|nr:MFS transporter [Burkholderia ubonensis]
MQCAARKLTTENKVVRKVRRPGTPAPEQPKPQTFRDQLGFYRDILDAILKTGAIALPIPAILIYSCLRLIGHTELFSASILSLAGLSAYLQAVLLVWLAIVVCIVAPSTIIYMFLGGSPDKRPAKGLPQFVLLSSVVWAVFYSITFELWDNGMTGWPYWLLVVGALITGTFILGRLAWKSPNWMVVIPHYDREDDNFHWPSSLATLVNKNRTIARAASFVRKRRPWRCLGVTTVIVASGFYSMQAILAVYSFSQAYPLAEHGWRAAATLCIIILVSLLPAAIYLKARVSGASHGSAAKTAATFIFALFIITLLNGVSLVPLAMGTMKAMGIVDNTPRTYEIMKADERHVYKALGYAPKAGDRFVEAFIRFQFADAKLVCPRKYDFPVEQSRTTAVPRGTSSGASALSTVSEDARRRADSAGCLTPTRDEIRVVDLPSDFTFLPKPPAAVLQDKSDNADAPERPVKHSDTGVKPTGAKSSLHRAHNRHVHPAASSCVNHSTSH